MNKPFASGRWVVMVGQESEFIRRWMEFLGWTRSSYKDLQSAQLILDNHNPRRFVSFAGWSSADALNQWRSSPGFAERFGACRALCDEFEGSDYTLAATV
jgi:heme-degrading monooxygenase HmoA